MKLLLESAVDRRSRECREADVPACNGPVNHI
jgi:hypothetical protein